VQPTSKKPNNLFRAIATTLALLFCLTFGQNGHAVYLNSHGTGEVLFYSLYTVEGGIDSLININNVSDDPVAVKVRFLESLNGREVFAFNLYLAGLDIWTAAIIASEVGVEIVTNDASCTIPNIKSSPPYTAFSDAEYLGDSFAEGREFF